MLPKIEECEKCQLGGGSNTYVVNGKGSLHAKIMIIGEAPGEEENLKREPFVGRSGRLLSATLAKLGVKREDIYITNIVKCRPPANRKPFAWEISVCQEYLQKEIEVVSPGVIITLGKTATETIWENISTMGEANGKLVKLASGVTVVPVYHPSAVLRNSNLKDSFERGLKVAIDESKRF